MTHSTATTLPKEIADQIVRESAHFSAAPAEFLQAWKCGVLLAGFQYFGTGSRAPVDQAVKVSDLTPNVPLITRAIGPMSAGERIFLATLVSFYDTDSGSRLLRRVGVHGLADLGRLDLQRRGIIATLLLNYTGW